MSRTGRPTIKITDELCAKAEILAAQGLTQDEIALTLGMGRSTLYEKKKDFPDFLDAIERGQAKGMATITNALFQKGKSGDTPAIKYYLSNRNPNQWSERRNNKEDNDGGQSHEEWLKEMQYGLSKMGKG